MYAFFVPRYAIVIREVRYRDLDYFVVEEGCIDLHVNHFWKLLVEKPVDVEIDHYIDLCSFHFTHTEQMRYPQHQWTR